jgi:hypothetical protein
LLAQSEKKALDELEFTYEVLRSLIDEQKEI